MAWYRLFDEKMAAELPLVTVLKDETMDRHTTFRVGGPARRLALPSTLGEITALLQLAEHEQWPVLAVGNGSNLLVSDEGLDRLVIVTTGLDFMEFIGEDKIRCGAGTKLSKLAVAAMERELAGLAFAHGIPGTLGGAVFMNAGAYGGEMSHVVESVTAWMPGRGVCELTAEELEFGYRHSCFSGGEGVVLAAVLKLNPGKKEEIKGEMEQLIQKRRASQPLEWPSAGSAFKRPVGFFAGTLIEQCGLKGLTVGGAQISEKHAGFVINRGGATCADILALMEEVKRRVKEQTGVTLEAEIRTVH